MAAALLGAAPGTRALGQIGFDFTWAGGVEEWTQTEPLLGTTGWVVDGILTSLFPNSPADTANVGQGPLRLDGSVTVGSFTVGGLGDGTSVDFDLRGSLTVEDRITLLAGGVIGANSGSLTLVDTATDILNVGRIIGDTGTSSVAGSFANGAVMDDGSPPSPGIVEADGGVLIFPRAGSVFTNSPGGIVRAAQGSVVSFQGPELRILGGSFEGGGLIEAVGSVVEYRGGSLSSPLVLRDGSTLEFAPAAPAPSDAALFLLRQDLILGDGLPTEATLIIEVPSGGRTRTLVLRDADLAGNVLLRDAPSQVGNSGTVFVEFDASPAAVANSGTIILDNLGPSVRGSVRVFRGAMINEVDGLIELDASDLNVEAVVTNLGDVVLHQSVLTIGRGGLWRQEGGQIVEAAGGTASTVTVAAGGTLDLIGGAVDPVIRLLPSGRLNLGPAAAAASIEATAGSGAVLTGNLSANQSLKVMDRAVLTVDDGFVNNGMIELGGTAALSDQVSRIDSAGIGRVINRGDWVISAPTTSQQRDRSVLGSFENDAQGRLTIGANTRFSLFTAGLELLNRGDMAVAPDGVVLIDRDRFEQAGGTLTLDGELIISGAGASFRWSAGSVGRTDGQTPSIRFTDGSTTGTRAEIADGRNGALRLEVAGGNFLLDAASLGSQQVLAIESEGLLGFRDGFVNRGRVEVTASGFSDFRFSGPFDVVNQGVFSFTQNGGSSRLVGTFENQGLLELEHAEFTIFRDALAAGDFAQTVEGRLSTTISMGVDGPRADRLIVGNQAILSGELIVESQGFEPRPGDRFIFLTFASRLGRFDRIVNNTGLLGVTFDIEYGPTSAELIVGSVLPGDLNGDGFIGAGDLDILLDAWNLNADLGAPTDLNGDGFVGAGDLDLLLANWNRSLGASGSAVATPEPASLALLGAGLALAARRRR